MTIFQPPQTSFPISAFESLQPALIKVLKAVHDEGGSDEVQHRVAIANAVSDLSHALHQSLPPPMGTPNNRPTS